MKIVFLLACVVAASAAIPNLDQLIHPKLKALPADQYMHPEETETNYWKIHAQSVLKEKLRLQNALNTNKAKNVIMFLGDGMSVHTLTATRAYVEDIAYQLEIEKSPYFGLSKTYCVDVQVADSACTATAYLSGVKGNTGTIGLDGNVPRKHCSLGLNKTSHAPSIAKWAQDAGKATGVVTTTRITHASPAGVYAHTPNRDWENDAMVAKDNCSPLVNHDIAKQLIHGDVGRKLNVIFGGGRSEFIDSTMRDEEGRRGLRADGRNLIDEWLEAKENASQPAAYVWSRKGLMDTDLFDTQHLLGLFSSDHCPFSGDRRRDNLQQADPSLTEMTEAAIQMLQKEKNGFFLFVEGGRIDHAHHYAKARKALEDTNEFDNAIKRARQLTSDEDTLIVITSDHSHTMSINGYATRDSDILGLNPEEIGDDNLPYTILSYANGPGYNSAYDPQTGRRDLREDNLKNPEYEYPGTVLLDDESHGGEDVGVFASGPQAHIFSGVYEQSNIPMMMAKIAEIGPYANNA